MSHLKSFVVPKSWTLKKKETVFVTRPNPGAHPAELSISFIHMLRTLGFANTVREAKQIIKSKEVTVDCKAVKDYKQLIGFMDVVRFKPLKKILRVLLDKKGRLTFVDITEAEADKKVAKVRSKTTVKGGKIQLNLSDGRNILTDKECVVGDSVVFTVPFQKIEQVLKLEKGASVYLVKGRHTGATGIVEDIRDNRLWFKTGKEVFETLKDYAFVVGKFVKIQ